MLDQVKLQDSERLDRTDMEHLAAAPLNALQSLVGTMFVCHSQYTGDAGPGGEGRPRSRIISGFKLEVNGLATAKQLLVKRGTALLAMRDALNQPVYGVPVMEGDTQKVLDLSSYADGTYGVWVRFELVDSSFGNRLFWDPNASKEYAQNVATRKTANWGLTLVLGGGSALVPGAEWTYLGDAVIASGSLAVTPKRVLYFEGAEALGYDQPWGASNDRNADRGVYGLQDVYSFVSATLQKLKEVQGHNWWEQPADPLNNKISKSGDTASGDYTFNGGGLKLFHVGTSFRADYDAEFLGESNYFSQGVQFDGIVSMDGTMTVGGALKSGSGMQRALGDATGGRFGTVYGVVFDAGKGAVGLDTGADHMVLSGTALRDRVAILPNGTLTGGVYFDGGAVAGHGFAVIEPVADQGVSLGASNKRWLDMYAMHGWCDDLMVNAYAITPELRVANAAFSAYSAIKYKGIGGGLTGVHVPGWMQIESAHLGLNDAGTAPLFKLQCYESLAPELFITGIDGNPVAGNVTINNWVGIGNFGAFTVYGKAVLGVGDGSANPAGTDVLGTLRAYRQAEFRPPSGASPQSAQLIDVDSSDPATAAYFRFWGTETNAAPYGVDPVILPPGVIYNAGGDANGRRFVAVHVKTGGSYQTRWIELLKAEDLPGYTES